MKQLDGLWSACSFVRFACWATFRSRSKLKLTDGIARGGAHITLAETVTATSEISHHNPELPRGRPQPDHGAHAKDMQDTYMTRF
jgi:hypothetical protein